MGPPAGRFKAGPTLARHLRFARRRLPPVISVAAPACAPAPPAARESMGRDHNPVPGQWYESLDDEEVFQVLSVDEDAELIELQYEDGDVEEIEYEEWQGRELALTDEREGWSGSGDVDEEGADLDG